MSLNNLSRVRSKSTRAFSTISTQDASASSDMMSLDQNSNLISHPGASLNGSETGPITAKRNRTAPGLASTRKTQNSFRNIALATMGLQILLSAFLPIWLTLALILLQLIATICLLASLVGELKRYHARK